MFETKFTLQDENLSMVVEREFAGNRDAVWRAWTDSTVLDQWWAPKPWKAVTKSFDFSDGGEWLYSMNGPEGEKHWAIIKYERVNPKDSFSAQDAFSDENGTINSSLPATHWHTEFTDSGVNTTVTVTISFPDAESMNKTIEMGFKEGFAMAHGNLDELLAQ